MNKLIKYSIFFFIGLYTAKLNYHIGIPLFLIFLVRIRYKLLDIFRKLRGKIFNGQDMLFKVNIKGISVYAEYGVGESTVWVLKNTKSNIIAVDSSKEWLEKIKLKTSSRDTSNRIDFNWVDLGPLSNWGKPTSYAKIENIDTYLNYIWQQSLKPNLVLIDGRFRVACFLTCLLKADSGTKLIFDDYVNRPYYHIIEKIIEPAQLSPRQALFIVPVNIDKIRVQKYLEKFLLVMD